MTHIHHHRYHHDTKLNNDQNLKKIFSFGDLTNDTQWIQLQPTGI
jgi:hypothetical protein